MAAAYELARSAALGGRAGGGGHGAAVIRARGVAAWLQVQVSQPADAMPVPAPALGVPLVPAGPAVTVLAAMTLAALAADTAATP
jgi:hypothetical protein